MPDSLKKTPAGEDLKKSEPARLHIDSGAYRPGSVPEPDAEQRSWFYQ